MKQGVISGNVDVTTDYVFRGFSQTDENPAIQGELDLTYNMLYLGLWGSSLNMGTAPTGNPTVFEDVANLEIDWYGGIRPTWQRFTFDIGDIYYAYPILHLSELARLHPRPVQRSQDRRVAQLFR